MPDSPRSGQTPEAWIAEAITTGRLQRLQPSMAAAGDMVNRARTHIRSAEQIAATDPTLALSACHDAARQALSAHLRAAGCRVAAEPGAHRLVIEYARTALAAVITDTDLVALDDLRRDRNTAEYGDFAARNITPDRAQSSIELANRVVNAVAAALAGRP